jgi:hypothetical protein
MRFTEHHEVERPDDADWFDLNVEMDSPLYLDPFLVFDDTDPHWTAAHGEIIDFFDAALSLLRRADDHRESMHWVKVQRFLAFPEPREFALGLSMGRPEGAGIGTDLAREMAEGLEFFRERGRGSDDRLLAMMAVLVSPWTVVDSPGLSAVVLHGRAPTSTQRSPANCGDAPPIAAWRVDRVRRGAAQRPLARLSQVGGLGGGVRQRGDCHVEIKPCISSLIARLDGRSCWQVRQRAGSGLRLLGTPLSRRR